MNIINKKISENWNKSHKGKQVTDRNVKHKKGEYESFFKKEKDEETLNS